MLEKRPGEGMIVMRLVVAGKQEFLLFLRNLIQVTWPFRYSGGLHHNGARYSEVLYSYVEFDRQGRREGFLLIWDINKKDILQD